FCSIGEAVFGVLPVGKQRPPKRPSPVFPAAPDAEAAPEFTLTGDQRDALGKILPAVENAVHKPFLLRGVAAAGKTEVYLRAIAAALARGRSALYLVPEIGLTPQSESILRARFGSAVDV